MLSVTNKLYMLSVVMLNVVAPVIQVRHADSYAEWILEKLLKNNLRTKSLKVYLKPI
jgi:hypothetical protein